MKFLNMQNEAMNIDYVNEENDNENENYTQDFEINNSSIDLDVYISGYTGFMRISRLIFLAEHCPPLRVEALKSALNFVTETYNTGLYTSIHKQLCDAINKQNQAQNTSTPLVPYDHAWAEATNKKAALKLEKLDLDLKSSKSSSIKDSIRRGQEDSCRSFS